MGEGKRCEKYRYRHLKYITIVTVIIAIIVVLFNLIAVEIENKFGIVGDFSRTSMFSLSDDSKAYINQMNDDIIIYGAFEHGKRDNTIIGLLRAFDRASDNITFKLVDPVSSVVELSPFVLSGQPITSGTVVISNADNTKYKVLDYYDFYLIGESGIMGITAEQSIISAIHYVQKGMAGNLLLVTGHNEREPSAIADFIVGSMVRNFSVSNFEITEEAMAKVSEKSDVMIFSGPEKDLTDDEYRLLSKYLLGGGKAIFYMDKAKSVDNGAGIRLINDSMTNFRQLFAQAGLTLNNDLVLVPEVSARLGSITMFNPVLNKSALDMGTLDNNLYVSECSSVKIADNKPNNAVYVAISPAGCYAKEVSEKMSTLDQEPSDRVGSFPVSALAKLGEGTIYLAGSSSFITGSAMQNSDNKKLALKLPSIMLGDTDNPVIHPTLIGSGQLDISTFSEQIMISILVLGVIPLIVLITGLVVTRRRKCVK